MSEPSTSSSASPATRLPGSGACQDTNPKACAFCDVKDPRDGKFLRCLHVICSTCLQEQTTAQGCVKCATCQEVTQPLYPSARLSKQLVSSCLQGDNSADHDTLSDEDGSLRSNILQCDFCRDARPSTCRCEDCHEALLCDNHSAAHATMRQSRHDTRIPLKSDGAASTPVRTTEVPCPMHSPYKLCHFCVNCDVEACEQCMVREHQGHTAKRLSAVVEEMRAALKTATTHSQDTAAGSSGPTPTDIEAMKKRLQSDLSTANDEADIASQHITETFTCIKDLVDKKKEELLGEVDMLRWKKQTALEARRRRLTSLQATQSTAKELARHLSGPASSDFDVVSLSGRVLRNLEQFSANVKSEEAAMTVLPEVQTFSTSQDLEHLKQALQGVVIVVENYGSDLGGMTAEIPQTMELGKACEIKLTIPCSEIATRCGSEDHQPQVVASLVSSFGNRQVLPTISEASNERITAHAQVEPETLGEHTLQVRLGKMTRHIPLPVKVQRQLRFDPDRCSTAMCISDSGKVVKIDGSFRCAQGHGYVYGTEAYSTGVHIFSLKVSGQELNLGYMQIGVAEFPPQGEISNSVSICHRYGAGWARPEYQFRRHLKYEGGNSKTSPWINGEVLTFTVDCDANSLQLCLPRTGERREIKGLDVLAKPLYLCVNINHYRKDRMVEIV
ncbi:E3 ubiquitin-protein ligase TRIM45-like [Sycon ciliatum]|uniref:E3 ubiquitin-protein ligase TRIM45-like n=1 Tax=Sycon ciliatum TaxID=27933 RepID=UPI0031F69E79